MSQLLLVLDIGSTKTKCAVMDYHQINVHFDWLSNEVQSLQDYQDKLDQTVFANGKLSIDDLDGVVIGNVTDRQTELQVWLNQIFQSKPVLYVDRQQSDQLILAPLHVTGYPLSELGIDRLANAVAAFQEFNDKHTLVLDCGTYTTIELVSKDGEFMGGAIMLGPELFEVFWTKAPFHNPEPLCSVFIKPQACPGTSTVSSIQNGLYYGFKGMMVEVVSQQLTGVKWSSTTTQLVITGGHAKELQDMLSLEFPHVHMRPHLTLKGLSSLWTKNKPQLTHS